MVGSGTDIVTDQFGNLEHPERRDGFSVLDSRALVPETTCEEQNRLLDRGVVIGSLQSPGSGFFNFTD